MKLLHNLTWLLAAGFLASNIAVAGKEKTPEFIEGTTRVSAEEVIELVEELPDLVILDARKASDYKKGYIEGAVSLPNTDTNRGTLKTHVKSKRTPIMFYCNGERCGRSVKAAKIALAAGYKRVYWFRGGMEEWEAKGLPLVHP
ncbi:MAG: rhodanese-like domain-containing protein [Gammaproteobacteria bacterium]|nr:rhodanese-like domain-containing protein [Gammaproteobacteria bacterium]MDH5728444.1 rhodanese-like domain-containing protein [Gammaproteobacteria bacterium]